MSIKPLSALNTRIDIEQRERAALAPYAMTVAASRGRAHSTRPDPFRTEFQRDRDRIVHARSFRRLQGKTQVFIDGEGDHFRNRLTHTIEVAQVSRGAARRLGLNEDLVECIALVHDLGHPPFGHRGEDMLASLMEQYGGFEHNRQSLRVVEELEVRYPEHPGLDLSYEVRESIMKHGSRYDPARTEQRFQPGERPLLEAQLTDALDSVVYDCHDIDDGLRGGYIALSQLAELPLWDAAWREAIDASPRAAPEKLLLDRALRHLMDALIDDCCTATLARLAADHIAGLAGVRAATRPLVVQSQSMAERKNELEQFLLQNLYRHHLVNASFHRARRMLADVFAFYTDHPDALPPEHVARARTAGLHRTIADYLAGMTDRFALDEHRRLCA
ncbi:MAG: deoxyguanosinetriphosphate triphosphohydrolase [Planctomycetota bacterium]